MLSEAQKEMMRHALGLHRSATPYRNHYFVAYGSQQHAEWISLSVAGLAERIDQGPGDARLIGYRVTEAGRKALEGER